MEEASCEAQEVRAKAETAAYIIWELAAPLEDCGRFSVFFSLVCASLGVVKSVCMPHGRLESDHVAYALVWRNLLW
ncbi:MAG TPA: hypothetical protein VH590_09800 [Ktedonobacterales bacterium]